MAAPDLVLKRLRERNIKPFELQKALNVSPSMASRILDGSRGVSSWHLDAVAGLLGMTLSELFDEAVSAGSTGAREGSSYENKSSQLYKIAQPGSTSVRENKPPVRQPEDFADAHAAHDRSSHSQAAIDAEEREIDQIEDRLMLAQQLYSVIDAADAQINTIRNVAEALRTGGRTPAPRKKPASKNGSRNPVRRPGSPRRRRA